MNFFFFLEKKLKTSIKIENKDINKIFLLNHDLR